MIRLFKHYVPYAVLLLGAIDFALLLLAAEAGWALRLWQVAGEFDPCKRAACPTCSPSPRPCRRRWSRSGSMAFEALQSVRFAIARLLVAVALGIILLSAGLLPLPAGRLLALEPALRDLDRACRDGAGARRAARRARRRALQAPGPRARRGPRAARLEALAQSPRRRLHHRRLYRDERRAGRRSPARSTATTSPACPIICCASAPARSCLRSRSGATRCR